MRLFRTAPKERALTTMLRHMEQGRFVDAWRALKQHDDPTPVPPHALERLGRWLADRGEFKKAVLPLRTFLDTYANHQDRPTVVTGLATCLKHLGKAKEAKRVEAAS
jgi:hypothetical protein